MELLLVFLNLVQVFVIAGIFIGLLMSVVFNEKGKVEEILNEKKLAIHENNLRNWLKFIQLIFIGLVKLGTKIMPVIENLFKKEKKK